ncbi:hypothetical protein Tco_0993753, partial [Tanacetum coccineum]
MAGPEPITPLNEGTSNQNTTKSIIEGHVSALKELLNDPSNRDLIKPMLLDFDDIQDFNDEEIEVNKKGKAKAGGEDLRTQFKEVLKCPFTRRIVEFSSPGHRMPANASIYDRTGDPEEHVGRFGMLKACDKDPMEILKIVRRAKETLPKFKESTNDCFHLKKQLEIALESGKLNHLVKDVRQKGRGDSGTVLRRKARVLEGTCQTFRENRARCVLWGKWAMLEGNNGETPYSLTFESEAVIPIEIGIPTHRTMMVKEKGGNKEEMRLNLDLLQKRREAVAIREARYKMKMEHYYNKR